VSGGREGVIGAGRAGETRRRSAQELSHRLKVYAELVERRTDGDGVMVQP
jgi:hypothetical protein